MTRPTVMRAGSMRVVRIATLLIFSILLVDLAAQSTPAGRWRAVFVDPARGMATFNEVILVLKADGDALTGTAEMDPWPGLAAITNGKIDGDSFSFTWTGTRPSSGGIPHMTFTGTVDGDRMKLTMISDGGTMEMRGRAFAEPLDVGLLDAAEQAAWRSLLHAAEEEATEASI